MKKGTFIAGMTNNTYFEEGGIKTPDKDNYLKMLDIALDMGFINHNMYSSQKMYYVDEISLNDIAAKIGKNILTIKETIKRASRNIWWETKVGCSKHPTCDVKELTLCRCASEGKLDDYLTQVKHKRFVENQAKIAELQQILKYHTEMCNSLRKEIEEIQSSYLM